MRFSTTFCRRDRISRATQRARRRATGLSLEALEERVVLSSIKVTSLADSGPGTLRAAIVQANATPPSPNPSNWPVITFDFSQISPPPPSDTIELKSALPAVTADNVTIGGSSGQGVQIDGKNAGFIAGLKLFGKNDTLQNVEISNCNAAGVESEGTDQNISSVGVEDCSSVGFVVGGSGAILDQVTAGGDNFLIQPPAYGPPLGNGVGIDVSQAQDVSILGSTITFNHADGILVLDSTGVNIGFQVGTDPGARAVPTIIQNNGGDGVEVFGGSTPGTAQSFTTSVANCMIGANSGNGVHLVGSSGNFVGGIVDDSTGRPVTWTGDATVAQGGYPQAGNGGDGVLIEGLYGLSSQNNSVIDVNIAGNNGNGVHLTGPGTSQTTIQDNYIGAYFGLPTDPYEPPPLMNQGNVLDGVAIDDGAHDNQVGGEGLFVNGFTATGLGNIIGNNDTDGVGISDPGTERNFVQGNMIGWADVANVQQGDLIVGGNRLNGVRIANGATIDVVGGTGGATHKTGYGNVIGQNGQSGVDLTGNGTSSDWVFGNMIGTDPNGTSAHPNFRGVMIEAGASNDHIGLALVGAGRSLGNLISGNFSQGIVISDASNNVIEADAIGTDLQEDTALPNGVQGILITDASGGNRVGGADNVAEGLLPGNVISGNGLSGVDLDGAFTTGNLVEGNVIGTDALITKPVPNATVGVYLTDSAWGNTIGGAAGTLANDISGNLEGGVYVDDFAHNNLVQDNLIGLSPNGVSAVGNGGNGVSLLSDETTVQGNVISANLGDGVAISGSLNAVQGNLIGTDPTGLIPQPNHLDGVFMDVLSGIGGNWIGGIAPGATNVISGNLLNGIHLVGSGTGDVIMGNRIGTDGSGKVFVPNDLDGVLLGNAWSYTIGGLGPNTANVISANTENGVEISGGSSRNDVVLNNLIGTDPLGEVDMGNSLNGILIDNGASFNTIGGEGPGDGNLISANNGDGILILGGLSITDNLPQSNRIMGNKIGTDFTGSGTFPLGNAHDGVEIWTAFDNTIGGLQPGEGNQISGNGQDGILLFVGSSMSQVQGNLIGTTADGTYALPNLANGVEIYGSRQNTIGGPFTLISQPGNVISGNHQSGLVIRDAQGTQNLVEGNLIGTTRLGNAPLPNQQDGVDILAGASSNTIGGAGGVGLGHPGNVIACNTGDGVQIDGAGTNGNTIAGNAIGAYAPSVVGKGNSGNGGNGVSVYDGAQQNMIGGTLAASGNVIANNSGAGVAIGRNLQDNTMVSDAVLSNSIYDNVGIGIDLASDGVTPNTPGSPHTGPNNLLSTPVIEIARSPGPGQLTLVQLSLNAAPNAKFTIQLFASPTPGTALHGNGKTLLTTITVMTDNNGNWTLIISLPVNLTGQYLTATTTDAMNDTSELSAAYRVL